MKEHFPIHNKARIMVITKPDKKLNQKETYILTSITIMDAKSQ